MLVKANTHINSKSVSNNKSSLLDDPLISPKEMAALCKCHLHSIYRLTQIRAIPFRRLPGVGIRFRLSEVERWIEENAEGQKDQREEARKMLEK